MKLKSRKALALVCIGTISAGAMTLSASQLSKTAKLVYNNIKVRVDGEYKTPKLEPFFIGDSVYVSLRDAGELTNNQIGWDNANQTVDIKTGNSNVSAIEVELANKNAEIARLKSQIKQLEEQVEAEDDSTPGHSSNNNNSSSTTGVTIESILQDIKKDYGFKHDISWSYTLEKSGSDKLILTMKYDSDRDGDDFKYLSEGTLKNLVRTIVTDIQDAYGDVKIEGKVYDTEKKETAATFTLTSTGNYNFNYEKKTAYTKKQLEDFQKDLEEEYYKFPEIKFGEIYDGTSIRLSKIELLETSGNLEYGVHCTFMGRFNYAWNAVEEGSATDKLEAYMDDIQEEIEDKFDVRNVTGYLYNDEGHVMAEYSNGDLKLRKIK